MPDEPTDRELQVLEAYVETGSYVAAARKLGVSENTVKNHLANVRAKCRARTTAQAVWILAPAMHRPAA